MSDPKQVASLRVIVPPITLQNGRLEFSTVTIEMPLYVTNSEIFSINIDENKQPKFSPCENGVGWCSPPVDRMKQLIDSGLEVGLCQIIHCKCQRSSNLSPADRESLEQTGHVASCEHATPRTVTIWPATPPQITEEKPPVSSPTARPKDPVVKAIDDQEAKKKAYGEFCPEGGIKVKELGQLIAYLSGTSTSESSVGQALKDSSLDAPGVREDVVIRQLVKFHNFTGCVSCGNWNRVASISNPRCDTCTPRPQQ